MSDNIEQNFERFWGKEGLRFQCTQCGQCCTGAPGYVWLEKADIEKLQKRLQISQKDFYKKYTRLVSGKYSLLEDPTSYDCIFLKDKKCSVYEDRPSQCKKFPFWKSILSSKKSWEKASQICEGINHPEAPILSLADIEKRFFN